MLILFGLFFLLLLMGASIAMSMFISSVAFMVVYGLPLELIAQRLAAGVDSFPLLPLLFLSWRKYHEPGRITKRILL